MFKAVKKSWLQISLLVMYFVAIGLLMVLDYFDLEAFPLLNERGFYFDYTWVGRLFLLFFLWLFVLEFLNIKQSSEDLEVKPVNRIRIVAALACAAVPLIYVVAANFLGCSQAVIDLGDAIRGDYWEQASQWWELILNAEWVIVFEYLLFTFSFLATILLAYGKRGLKDYSITVGLIGGITAAYSLDVFFPYGVLRPLQMMTLPTAAFAAGFLELIGYTFYLNYSPGAQAMPTIRLVKYNLETGSGQVFGPTVSIAWPCAGVHSLFLYTLIILLLFKKSEITGFRKLVYFVVGAVGTYTVNILRIATYFIILNNTWTTSRMTDAQTFHDVYGDLFSVIWILSYMLLIMSIEKFGLAEKAMKKLQGLCVTLRLTKREAPSV
jgi:thaumarchaeosortase